MKTNNWEEDMKEITIFDIFCLGIDYGQYLIENEIFHENWVDIMGVIVTDKKYSMNSQQILRQPHSEKWLEAKRKSYEEYLDIIAKLVSKEIKIKEI